MANYLYPSAPKHCLPWSYRLPQLMREVALWQPDVVCMQVRARASVN